MSSSGAVATVPGPPTSSGGSIDSVRQQILAYVTSVADSEGYCYYFAYGSNMNAKVLSGRRKVFPVESYPMKTPGWVMRYASRGACYLEPAFGVIIPRPDNAPASEPDAHGVAHRITVLEFLQIVATVGFGQYLSLIEGHLINVSSTGRQEGGGGHPELGYSIVEVVAETTSEPKRTLQRVLSLGAGTKCRFDLLCSARYKAIVVDGAKEGNVEPSYIEYLESIPHYDPSGTVGRRIGRMCFLGIFGLFIMPAFLMTSKLKLEAGGKATYLLQRLWLSPIRRTAWWFHDYVLQHLLGSGANNDGLPQLPALPISGPLKAIAHHGPTSGDTALVASIGESSDPHTGSA